MRGMTDKARAMVDLPPLRPICERIIAAMDAAEGNGLTVREHLREEIGSSFDDVWHAFDRLSTRGFIKSNGYRAVHPKATIAGVQDYAAQEPIYFRQEEQCIPSSQPT